MTIGRLPAGLLLFSSVLCAQSAAVTAPAADIWKPLRFLVGTWEAKTQGGSAASASSGTYTFQLELRGHVLARRTKTAGCKGPDDFDCEHGDLLYVYPEPTRKHFQAIYWDNEGHVIHYEVTASAANRVVFASPASQPGPQYRLVYELKAGAMYGRFQIRMPEQNEFKSYLEWSGKRMP